MTRLIRLLLATLLPLLAALPLRADPGYYVVTAYDNAGQRSVDFRYWTVQKKGRRERIWPEVGFSYGVNSRWTTELFTSYIGPSNWDLVPSSLNWQNDVLLTQGEWPVDVAVHTQLIRETGYGGKSYAFEYGPALQTDIGRTQLNANLFFERSFEDQADPIQLKYQWQVRHRWHPWLDFGAQGFGELGRWNHWANGGEQSHRAGPAVFGHLDLGQPGERNALLYQAAYLLGTIYSARGHMFTLRLQYAF
ncbi:MAG TPA: hypothetical protein VGQ91_11305 [Ideonella sp.]|nr:hypothetical protein [Ideonella sp.]